MSPMTTIRTRNQTTILKKSRCYFRMMTPKNSTNNPTTNWMCRCSILRSNLRRAK